MTEAERIARGQRASSAWSEFIAPIVAEMRSTYTERLVEIANTELHRDKRGDKITALSNALRILSQLENGMIAAIRDGDLARQETLRARKIESMTAPQRRLLGIAPGY